MTRTWLNTFIMVRTIHVKGRPSLLHLRALKNPVVLVSVLGTAIPLGQGLTRSTKSSRLLPGEFPAQRPVTWSFDVFFDLRLNKWLSKQSWGWWFETLSCPLWGHSNGCRYDFLCSVVSVAFWWSWSLLSYQWLSNKPYISLTIVTDSFQIKCVLNH